MKVKCIKTVIKPKNKSVINYDVRGFISENDILDVFGISISDATVYVYVFNGEHLFDVPLDLFEILDTNIGLEWKIKKWSDKSITIWPELFYVDDFLENFAEREDKERELFENLQDKIK